MLENDGDVHGEKLGELPGLQWDGVAARRVQVEAPECLLGRDEETQPYLGAQTASHRSRDVTRPPLLSAGVLHDHHGVTSDGLNAWPFAYGVLKVVKVENQLARS